MYKRSTCCETFWRNCGFWIVLFLSISVDAGKIQGPVTNVYTMSCQNCLLAEMKRRFQERGQTNNLTTMLVSHVTTGMCN